MKTTYSFKIFNKVSELPLEWNVLGAENVFLSSVYLQVLEQSAPPNMICHYIGIYQNEALVGIALSQFLNLNQLDTFGSRDSLLVSAVRNIVFKNLNAHILILGNNLFTGQNAFVFSDTIAKIEAVKTLKLASEKLKEIFKLKGIKVHVTTFKDFVNSDVEIFLKAGFQKYFKFTTQPNMVFEIPLQWNTEQDYMHALAKKYRDQYKRAKKKSEGIEKRTLNLEDILNYESDIYDLYLHVAKNAHFNTFFLAKNHFSVIKALMKDKFYLYGYFSDGKLIGFYTLFHNGKAIHTYFLGYDDSVQREKMLYLNMLYDMLMHAIIAGFKTIVFGRTALEIKSSIGAKPQEMYGFAKHSNFFIDYIFEHAFNYLEPKIVWQERSPFKD